MARKILPCPKCNSINVTISQAEGGRGGELTSYIGECLECDYSLPCGGLVDGKRDTAIGDWNREAKKLLGISTQRANIKIANHLCDTVDPSATKLISLGGMFIISSDRRRRIVCLCGSTKFKQTFEDANREESLKRHIVLTVAMFGHHEGLDMGGDEKRIFDELHMRKIDLADEIFVLNVGGYIGESTRREIDYAVSIRKPVRYLEQQDVLK